MTKIGIQGRNPTQEGRKSRNYDEPDRKRVNRGMSLCIAKLELLNRKQSRQIAKSLSRIAKCLPESRNRLHTKQCGEKDCHAPASQTQRSYMNASMYVCLPRNSQIQTHVRCLNSTEIEEPNREIETAQSRSGPCGSRIVKNKDCENRRKIVQGARANSVVNNPEFAVLSADAKRPGD